MKLVTRASGPNIDDRLKPEPPVAMPSLITTEPEKAPPGLPLEPLNVPEIRPSINASRKPFSYRSKLILAKYERPREFVIYRDFEIEFWLYGECYRLVIPAGYITDFASVPRIMQNLPQFGPTDASGFAAVPHDYNYSSQGRVRATWLHVIEDGREVTVVPTAVDLVLTRKDCDELLYQGLIASGYSRATAWAFYAGVRIGGRLYWNRRQRDQKGRRDFVPKDYFQETPP